MEGVLKDHSKRQIVFINQSTQALFVDIVNAFGEKFGNLTLLTGKKNNEDYLKALDRKVKTDFIVSYNKKTTLKRILTWGWGTFQIWWKVVTKYRKTELFIVSNPPMATLVPLFCRNPYSLLIYDTYPDVLIHSGILKPGSWIARWWKRKNMKLYKNALYVYTIGDGMAGCLRQYVEEQKIKVIPNWANTSVLKLVDKTDNLFIKQYKLEDKFVVLYSGNLGNTHKIETIVEVAERLKQERNIVFVIIGEGAKKKKIEEMVRDKALQNCFLLPYQSLDRLPHSLGAADIGIITLDLSASALSVPSKTYSMLAVGSALLCIAGRDSELAGIVEKYQVGEIFEPEEVKRIADFVLRMKNDAVKLECYKQNARKAALDFTPENARRYVEGYE